MTPETAEHLARCAVVFEVADPPRASEMAFYDTDGVGLPEGVGTAGKITLAVRDHDEPATVPALRIPVGEAVPVLSRARKSHRGHPAATFWGAATVVALQLVARGRVLPGVTAQDEDAWRIGPLDAADVERIRTLADAMPVPARAVPLPDRVPLELGDAEDLLRGFLDAVADGMPRSETMVAAGRSRARAERERTEREASRRRRGIQEELHPYVEDRRSRVPQLRTWAGEIASRVDSGVRISLRVDVPEPEGFIWGNAEPPRPGTDYPEEGPAFQLVVQVHGMSDNAMVADAADLWDEDAVHGEWGIGVPRRGPGAFGPRARTDAMLAVRRAAHAWDPLRRLLEAPVPDRIDLADGELEDLLTEGTSALTRAGVDVHWPKELVRDLTARVAVRPSSSSSAAPSDMPSIFGGETMFSFDWQLALGGEALTEAEMQKLAGAHRPLVKLRDQWVVVDPELARRARNRQVASVTAMEALGAALTGNAQVLTEEGEQPVEVVTDGWLEALRELIVDPDGGADLVEAPPALAATLRDYQLRGLRWLVRMTSLGLGACLADDMGLGKTVTLIALHLHRQLDPATAGPTLVVCPASLLGNWEREIERFAPGVPVRRFHGTGRSLEGLVGEGPAGEGFVLTTYGTMRVDVAPRADPAAELSEDEVAEPADDDDSRLTSSGQLGGVVWGLLVADEAQHVKNARSGTARALREVPSKGRVALTGTPVENNLSELWAVLDWTTPGLLGGLTHFRARWARPIEAYQNEETAAGLARLVRPFLLRRRKSDPGIAPELPPKTETDRPVTLTREQAGLYQAVVAETLVKIEQAEGIERRGLVLALLTALKQVCNHPAHYLKELPTAPSTRLRGRSGKLELLDELVDVIRAEGGAALVFTQYVEMARLLKRHLGDRGVPTLMLHGGTPVRRREAMVDEFQNSPPGEAPVFLLSLKAAGTGLNLTRADHVIHFDRWWNPAVEEQATDRAYRIGQTRPVQVHRLVTEGTVEDRIAQALAGKRALADSVLAAGESGFTELTDAELTDLVALRSSEAPKGSQLLNRASGPQGRFVPAETLPPESPPPESPPPESSS